jgi:prepilin-type N-terminal cleavage/methylation domain-containing protein/prepilin-type processing-associated H-X9-DG protein
MKRRGFTLIELLVVLTVIAVLAGIGIPLARSALAKSREASCMNQLRSLGVALESYMQDHGQKLPELVTGRASKTEDVPVLETVLLPYLESPAAFKCPQDTKEFEKSGSSYMWNSTQNGLHVSQLKFFGIAERPDKIPLIFDKDSTWHPGGTNFLYADQTTSNKPRFATGN